MPTQSLYIDLHENYDKSRSGTPWLSGYNRNSIIS